MTRIVIGLMIVCCAGCSTKLNDAQQIVDKAIEASGGTRYQESTIQFDFRDRTYIAKRDGGAYVYERITTDSTGITRDQLTNDGFKRFLNDRVIAVADTMAAKYSRSVNSVIYFALLPYALNDAAVKKKFLGTVALEGKVYYKIEVTFTQAGGGEDYEDVFHYWFNQEDFSIGYLAYSFHTDGGGVRFRKAIQKQTVNGITFLDYINYKPSDNRTSLDGLEDLYTSGELEELSVIELKNINVELN